jgi:glycosyltransferase involved in cell wall biosynthesis
MPKSDKTHVTVSIPYFQCKQYICKAVESILGQNHTNLTLVVVNDGDDNPPWDQLTYIDDPRLVRFDMRSNHGRYFADTVVLNATTDNYLVIQDADDWSEPDRISILLEILREDHSNGVVSAIYSWKTKDIGVISKDKVSFSTMNRPLLHKLEFRANHFGIFRTEALRNIGGFYGGFRISYDRLLINLLIMTGNLSYIDEPLYNRLLRPDSLSNSATTGMKSAMRKEVKRQLQDIYSEAFELYIEYLSGHIEAQTLSKLIRQICLRYITPKDSADLTEESNRLRAILSEGHKGSSLDGDLNGGSNNHNGGSHTGMPKGLEIQQTYKSMTTPLISVVIPARNESDRLPTTIRSITDTRSTNFDLEIVIVDDASTDDSYSHLAATNPELTAPGLSMKVLRVDERIGVPKARNYGAAHASGKILFITDAHVSFCKDWDSYILDHIGRNRVLAATIVDSVSGSKGYGSSLLVPLMQTKWNIDPPGMLTPIQISICSGTVLYKELFKKIGGYDSGMLLYGSAEPEFSVRAWLSGAEILSLPQLEVVHRFKEEDERKNFFEELAIFTIHNRLRFGLLYLNEYAALQMIRYFTLRYPDRVEEALQLLDADGIWSRKAFLEKRCILGFDWFIRRFALEAQKV